MADARVQDLDPVNKVQDNDNFVLEQNGKAHRLTGSKLIRYLITACDNLGILGLHVGSSKPAAPQNVWISMETGSPVLSVRNQDTGLFESIPVVNEKTTEDDFRRWNLEINQPVGSLFWCDHLIDPAEHFGGGVWEQVTDKFILAAGPKHRAGETGGEEEVTLSMPNLPNKSIKLKASPDSGWYVANDSKLGLQVETKNSILISGTQEVYNESHSQFITETLGNDVPHNNMPPYETYYCWRRTA